MIDKGLLDSGNEIPFPEAKLIIHPPRIKDISMIGQKHFYLGCELLNFSKDILDNKDNLDLSTKTDFDIFMSIMTDTNKISLENRLSAKLVLSLLFPDYEIDYSNPHNLVFIKDDEKFFINVINYEAFKELLTEMCCLNRRKGGDVPSQYNTKGKLGNEIRDKLMKARQKVAESNGEQDKEVNIFQRYISVLAVGLNKSKEDLYRYTIYQLFDEYERFIKKVEYDITIKAKLAGATGMKDVDNWIE